MPYEEGTRRHVRAGPSSDSDVRLAMKILVNSKRRDLAARMRRAKYSHKQARKISRKAQVTSTGAWTVPTMADIQRAMGLGLSSPAHQPHHAPSRFQEFNFSKWGGRTITSFAPLTSGSGSSATGVMVVKSSPDSIASTVRNYPHDTFMKFYFCKNNLPTTGALKGTGPIGYQDRVYSTSSADPQHLSWMVLELSRSQELWYNRKIGNSLLPAVKSAAGEPHYNVLFSDQSPWFQSSKVSTQFDEQAHTEMMVTIDRIPHSGDTSSQTELRHDHAIPVLVPSQHASGDPVGQESAFFDANGALNHAHYTGTLAGTTEPASGQATWVPPNHVVTGVDIDLTFNSASVVDQYLTVKLCRLVNKDAQAYALTTDQAQEVLNKQTVTDKDVFETVYQHSFYMPRMTTFRSLKNKTFQINKFIRCNYARSRTRLISSASTAASFGGMLSPEWTTGTIGTMYNNLTLVISSRVVDDQYVANNEYNTIEDIGDVAAGVHVLKSSTSEYTALTKLTQENDANAATTGFAKFGVSGSVTERFRVKDYSSPTYEAPG